MRGRILVFALAAIAAAASFLSPIEEAELRALDMQFRALRHEAPALQSEVVVVGIDDRSVASITEPIGLWHGYLARFLEALKLAPPALVGFDIVMPDRSFEGVAPGLDRELLRALLSTRAIFPTILGITVDNEGRPRGIHSSFLAAAGTTPAYVLWRVDVDGTIRRFDEVLGEKGEQVATLAGEAARLLGKTPRAGYIDYALGLPLGYVPFIDVLAAAERGDTEWLQQRLAGKAVLLGMVLPYTDAVRVPVQLASWEVPLRDTPGVLLHAHALRTILADRMVTRTDAMVVAALTLAAVLAALLATSLARAAMVAVMLLLVFPLASFAALRQGFFLPAMWPLAAGLLGIAIRQGSDVAARLAERRRLRSSFAGAVSPAVMRQILDGRIQPQQGGVTLEVCALFSDIRGFTTLSEGKSPEQIVSLLNRYFERMVEIIHGAGGTVVSFMGDGIYAIFGAPAPLANNAAAGFDAAVRMLQGVRDFNADIARENIAPIGIGVGLHVGEALVGHIGSKSRHDYTAIGDVINVASRLESATKEAGYRIVVSAEVAAMLADRSALAHLGPVSLKGHTPVDAYGYERIAPSTHEGGKGSLEGAARCLILGACIVGAAAISLGVHAQRQPGALALVSDLHGTVRVVRGGERATPAKLLADLFPDMRLELEGGAQLVMLMLASGEEIALRGPARAQLGADAVTAEPREAMTRRKSGVGGVQLRRRDLAQAAIVMRKADQTVRPPLLSLSGTYTLESSPVFRWTPVEDSGPYRVVLFDEAGKVLHEATTTATEHVLPREIALAPQRRYTWEVATRKANGVEHSNFGDFALATPEMRAEAASRRPRDDAPFSERLAYAVWLDTNELGDAARSVWTRLARERPGEEQLRRMAEQ